MIQFYWLRLNLIQKLDAIILVVIHIITYIISVFTLSYLCVVDTFKDFHIPSPKLIHFFIYVNYIYI